MKTARRGLVLSVEALLATLILFGSILIAAQLSASPTPPPSALPLLRDYAQDTLARGVASGAFLQPVSDAPTDNDTRTLISNLPSGVCVQVEVYNGSVAPANLNYSYTPPDCNLTISTPQAIAWRAAAYWHSSSSYDIYWIMARAYPRGGGA